MQKAAIAAAAMLSLAAYADELKPVRKVEFEFPREAAVAGADEGNVKARMTIDATGEVTRVEILEARPRRVFDRAVVKTLSQWKFEPGSGARTKEINVDFRLK